MSRPASADAEEALVNRLLLDPALVAQVAGTLDPDDLYFSGYRAAYEAMIRLHEEGKPIDIVTLGEAGVKVDILSLRSGHHGPVEEYAGIIKRKAYQRRMIEMGEALISAADDGDIERTIQAAGKASDLAITAPHDDNVGLVNLADYQESPSPPMLGVLSPEGTTVLYGDGGDGKGWIAAKWASQLGTRVAILDFENHPNEWAYRLRKFGLTNALYVAPPSTMERWANERTARLLLAANIGFLIIDSAMYASNVDDPYSPASALAYKRARTKLGNLPTLLLAHTSSGADKVFGSVFWRNEARIVWRLGKTFGTRQRWLECRKANNYSDLEGKKFNVEFDEDQAVLNLHEQGKPWSPESKPATEEVSEW